MGFRLICSEYHWLCHILHNSCQSHCPMKGSQSSVQFRFAVDQTHRLHRPYRAYSILVFRRFLRGWLFEPFNTGKLLYGIKHIFHALYPFSRIIYSDFLKRINTKKINCKSNHGFCIFISRTCHDCIRTSICFANVQTKH